MSEQKHDWKLPSKPEEPEKPKTLRIVVANPRPTVPYTLRPCEALVWDVLSRGTREYIDVVPGQFLGLPVDVLSECLDNLAGLGLLSGEGIEAKARRPHEWGADIQRMGAAKAKAEAQHAKLAQISQASPDATPREPRGFALPPVSPRIEAG